MDVIMGLLCGKTRWGGGAEKSLKTDLVPAGTVTSFSFFILICIFSSFYNKDDFFLRLKKREKHHRVTLKPIQLERNAPSRQSLRKEQACGHRGPLLRGGDSRAGG